MAFANHCVKCSRPLPAPVRRGGRPRLYCSESCRKAAYRQRKAAVGYRVPQETRVEQLLDARLATLDLDAELPSDPDEAVFQLILEGRALVRRLAHCADRARPQFAWRLEKASGEIAAVMRKYFSSPPGSGPS